MGVSAMVRYLRCMPISRIRTLSNVVGVGKGRPGDWYKYRPIFVTVIQSACIHREFSRGTVHHIFRHEDPIGKIKISEFVIHFRMCLATRLKEHILLSSW